MGDQPGAAPGLRDLAREIPIIAAALVAYFWVRGLTEGSVALAQANAADIIHIEKHLGLHWEPWAQRLILDRNGLVSLANWIYIWGHWPVIAVSALWLFFRRPATYFLLRNAFLISGAIGLTIFITYPLAPPRLADVDVIDTVTLYSHAYRVLQPPAWVNQYAAMPSLHFGWNMLIGGGLARESPLTAVRVFGWLMPTAMMCAVVLTANHYVIDVIAGAIVALIGLLLAWELRKLRRSLAARHDHGANGRMPTP